MNEHERRISRLYERGDINDRRDWLLKNWALRSVPVENLLFVEGRF